MSALGNQGFSKLKWIKALLLTIGGFLVTSIFILFLNGNVKRNIIEKHFFFESLIKQPTPETKLIPSTYLTASDVNKYGGESLTIHCNHGRLGNQMCTMASLFGVAKLNRRDIKVLNCNYNKLEPIFGFELPLLNQTIFKEKKPWSIGTYLRPKDHYINKTTNIIKGYYYPCSYTFFNHARKDIKKLFAFRSPIQNYANQAIEKFGERQNNTFVGVHVRRTDFLTPKEHAWLVSFEGNEVDMEYFEKATDYFKNKYDNVIFVAVSDDRPWCKEHLEQFGINVMDPSPGPAHDMAILATCDHVIMTYGTFGFWGAYLSGGDVTYFDKFLKPGTDFTTSEYVHDKMYLPEWLGISTNSSYDYSKFMC